MPEISDYDKYQLSKYFPGKYQPVHTYSASGDMTAAVATRVGQPLNIAGSAGGSNVPIGSHAFTIMMYCPVLSHIVVSNDQSPIDNDQPSGFFIYSTDDLDEVLSTNLFFGLNSTGSAGAGDESYLGLEQFTGYQSTNDIETFAYSGSIEAKFVIPAANLTGTMYSGSCRLASLFQTKQTPSITTAGKFTTTQLINISDNVSAMKSGVTLSSGIVNDYLLTHTLRTGEDELQTYLKDTDVGSEIVSFCVLQNPSINITTGDTARFTMIAQVLNNSVVIPGVSNLLLYRTFDPLWKGKQRQEMDFNYQGPLREGVKPPQNYTEVKRLESEIGKNHTAMIPTDNGGVSLVKRPPLRLRTAHSSEDDEHDVKIKKKRRSDSTSSEEDDPLDNCKIQLITRRQGAIRRLLASYLAEGIDIMAEAKAHKEDNLRMGVMAGISGVMAGMKLIESVIPIIKKVVKKSKEIKVAYDRGRKSKKGALESGVNAFLGESQPARPKAKAIRAQADQQVKPRKKKKPRYTPEEIAAYKAQMANPLL